MDSLLDDDGDVLAEAVGAYRDAGRILEAAQVAEEAGSALGRAGLLEEARPHFDEAVRVYEGLEASWDLGRLSAQRTNVTWGEIRNRRSCR